MSDDQIQVPRFQKEDLLRQHFNINDPNEENFHSASTSLSFSDSMHPQARLSFGIGEKRAPIFGKQMERMINPTKGKIHEMNDNFSKKSKIKPENKKEEALRQHAERVRKSSFYQVQDFSSNQLNFDYEPIEIPYLQKKELTQYKEQDPKSQSPYFKTTSNPLAHLIPKKIQQCQPKKLTNKSNLPFAFLEDVSFGMKQSPAKLQQKSVFIQKKIRLPVREKQVEQVEQKVSRKHQNGLNNIRSQPICFHCGGKHYYNQCTLNTEIARTTELKCLNCKKIGHTARFCIQQKKCNYCSSVQHIGRNCPSLQANQQSKVCYNCNQVGHFAKECTKPRKCYLCHELGHQIRSCPKNKQNNPESINIRISKPRTCFNCQKQGHYANQCTEPEKCHNCNAQGHYSRDCPKLGRSFSLMSANLDQPQKIQNTESLQKAQSQPECNAKRLSLNRFNFKKYLKSGKKESKQIQKNKKQPTSKMSRKSKKLDKK